LSRGELRLRKGELLLREGELRLRKGTCDFGKKEQGAVWKFRGASGILDASIDSATRDAQ